MYAPISYLTAILDISENIQHSLAPNNIVAAKLPSIKQPLFMYTIGYRQTLTIELE